MNGTWKCFLLSFEISLSNYCIHERIILIISVKSFFFSFVSLVHARRGVKFIPYVKSAVVHHWTPISFFGVLLHICASRRQPGSFLFRVPKGVLRKTNEHIFISSGLWMCNCVLVDCFVEAFPGVMRFRYVILLKCSDCCCNISR